MTDALAHRGPDGLGYLLYDPEGGIVVRGELEGSEQARVGFGHRRLSILDPSEASDQPMVDPTGTYALTYNGEIFNFVELRQELEALGHRFSTTGDTEVLLSAYAEWGPACLERFIGMWAFALLDLRRGTLFLSRDRFGIKPLYYTVAGDRVYFASEIKALTALPDVRHTPDEETVAEYLITGDVDHSERTFFSGITQLPPAHNLEIALNAPPRLQPHRYWTVPLDADPEPRNAVERFAELMADAVQLHARSDVPVGSCLSGGLDSTGIVCVAEQLRAAGQIPRYAHAAFGYVPSDPAFSERRYMDEVVAQTALDMTYVEVDRDRFESAIPSIVIQQDEPFGSASIAAQWFVFERARAAGMKVMLDGQGADEVLGGYHGYFRVLALSLLRRRQLREYARLSRSHRREFGAPVLTRGAALAALAPGAFRSIGRRARSGAGTGNDAVGSLVTEELRSRAASANHRPQEYSSLNQLLKAQTESHNLPALLRYEDRNSMAHSIEARVPYLDHRIVELAFSLSGDYKIHKATTKYVLREALAGVVPEPIRTRKDKVGFRADPAVTWDLARTHRASLLAARTPFEESWFDAESLRRLIDGPDASVESEFLLWRALNTKLWLRNNWGDGESLG